jgi:hypothetical protein
MCTICVTALQIAVEQKSGDPEFVRIFGEIRDRMNDNFYNPNYLDLVVSRRGRYRRYDLVDAYVFGQFASDFWSGYILTAEVGFRGTCCGPAGDRHDEDNNRLLSHLVPPFRGTFRGRGHGGDGYIEWTEPIKLERRLGDEDREYADVPPEQLLLEVGDLHLYNGWHHLRMGARPGFSRWPYGSSTITIMKRHRSSIERWFSVVCDEHPTVPVQNE